MHNPSSSPTYEVGVCVCVWLVCLIFLIIVLDLSEMYSQFLKLWVICVNLVVKTQLWHTILIILKLIKFQPQVTMHLGWQTIRLFLWYIYMEHNFHMARAMSPLHGAERDTVYPGDVDTLDREVRGWHCRQHWQNPVFPELDCFLSALLQHSQLTSYSVLDSSHNFPQRFCCFLDHNKVQVPDDLVNYKYLFCY